ncbi:hypothetical protein ACIQU6_28040 [Streptomyces sp. NPDC090442]|uniref:hypothetical protein n=1 Tax=Streptomyces sp. NPDC090442 TaxID=3365962 RepID=UPI0037FEB29B
MSTSVNPTSVPSITDRAKIVKVLGGTPGTYMPQGSMANEVFDSGAGAVCNPSSGNRA